MTIDLLGIDTAKNIFQFHRTDSSGDAVQKTHHW